MKKYRLLALLLAVLLLLTACGAKAGNTALMENYKAESSADGIHYGYASDTAGSTEAPSQGKHDLPEGGMKWVRTLWLDAQTRDMEPLLEHIQNQVNVLGGYIENREVYHGDPDAAYRSRNAELTVRIPVDRADEFVAQMGEQANVISSNETLENITLTYVATESRIKALETEQTRLLELLEKAETMSDLLEIETRLTQVRTELETVTSQLRRYDNLVDYATVHLNIDEVKILTPAEEEGFFQRIASGFVQTLEDLWYGAGELVIWVAVNLPYMVIWAAIALGVFLLGRKLLRKRKMKNAS